MRSIARIVGVVALICMIGAASASAKNVIVVNNTQYTLNSLYASASDASGWDTTSNLLSATLAPGQQVSIAISDGTSACSYDLMGVLYGAAQYAYQYKVNACDGETWTINQ